MNTAELLAWIDEIVALSWLMPAGLAFVYLRRRFQGRAGFTNRDHPLMSYHNIHGR